MRQPADPRKIVALMQYHVQLMADFRAGTLQGKIGGLIRAKAKDIGISVSTFYARKKQFGTIRNRKLSQENQLPDIIRPSQ